METRNNTMTDKISDERLRNTRAWAAAKVGSLSGADVIVGAIDELLEFRSAEIASFDRIRIAIETLRDGCLAVRAELVKCQQKLEALGYKDASENELDGTMGHGKFCV